MRDHECKIYPIYLCAFFMLISASWLKAQSIWIGAFSQPCIREKEWSKDIARNCKGVTLMMDQGMLPG